MRGLEIRRTNRGKRTAIERIDIALHEIIKKLSEEIISRNYLKKLSQEIITKNYHKKLSQEIITRNYHLLYYQAKSDDL